MKNQAMLAKQTELNAFTEELVAKLESPTSIGYVVVRTRWEGMKVVRYVKPDLENGPEFPMFEEVSGHLTWNADGSSVQSFQFDIIEF